MIRPQHSTLAEGRVFEGKAFPLALVPDANDATGMFGKNSLISWINAYKNEIDEMLRVHKAILIRDFLPGGSCSHTDFHDVVNSTGLIDMPYIGGAAVRTQLTSRVFTANESPSSEKIPFHHEMAQTPDPPTHLFFYCETSPNIGGETPILISTEVYDRMCAAHPKFMQQLEEEGVRYIRVMPEYDDPSSAIGRGWKSTFNAHTKEEAEDSLRRLGSSWEWLHDGSCRTITAALPAVRTDNNGDRRSNRKTFFNSIVAAYTGWNDSRNNGKTAVVSASDGQPLDENAMNDAVQIMEDVCVAFKWREGDVLIVDNRTCMHARRPFEGPRRILAAIARDPDR